MNKRFAASCLIVLISSASWGTEIESDGCSAPTPPSLVDNGLSCEELWRRQIGLQTTAKYSELARQSSDRFRQSVQAGEALIDQAILGAKMVSVASVAAQQGVGEEFVLKLTHTVADLAISSMPIDGIDDATRREALAFLNTAIAETIKTGMSANDPKFPIVAAADLSNKIVALWNANREIGYRNRDIVVYAVLTEYFLGDQSLETVKQKFKLQGDATDDALYDAIAAAYGLRGDFHRDKVTSIIKSVMRFVDLETQTRMALESLAKNRDDSTSRSDWIDPVIGLSELPIQAGEEFESNLVGTWRGPVSQRGYRPYSLVLQIFIGDDGRITGSSHYPEFPCGGTLLLIEESGDALRFEERIVENRGGCVDGFVELHPTSNDAMDWTWDRGGKTLATASLRKGRPAGSDTVSTDTAASSVALENSAVRAVSGSWFGDVSQPSSSRPYSLELEIQPGRSGGIDARSLYPELKCGGSLEFLGQTGEALRFRETITYNPARCTNGFVEVRPSNTNTLEWEFIRPNGVRSATATLQKAASGSIDGKTATSNQVEEYFDEPQPSIVDDELVARLKESEEAFRKAKTAVEFGDAVKGMYDASVAIDDMDAAVRLIEFFEGGSLSIAARQNLIEAREDLGKNVAGIMAEYLIHLMIDNNMSATRGRKDKWKSYASILIGGLSGGLSGYTIAAVVESTSTYLELSSEAQAFMTSEVDRAFRIAERIDSLRPYDPDLRLVRWQMEAIDKSAQHAQDVSSLWPQYDFTAVVLRSLGPILETKLQQKLELAPSSRSDVSSAYEAFATANLDCEMLTSDQTRTLVLILDQFAEDIGIEIWTPTKYPVGVAPSYSSC